MAQEPEADLKTLEGTLQFVVYTNEQNHWSVARFQVNRTGERITIVGVLPALNPGELLQVTGREIVHARFGPQFQVESFQPVVPTTEQGIRRYLESGVFGGTGKVLAERIVSRFGEQTLEIMDSCPEQLLQVPGIGKKKLARILDSWNQGRAARNTLVFLRGHGFGPALAMRVYEAYGSNAVNVARQQPYRLAHDVKGVGFILADRMARSLGVAEDDPDRLRAGLQHVLGDQIQNGHAAFPWPRLVERATRLLKVDALLVDEALAGLARDGRVRVDGRAQVDPSTDPEMDPEMDPVADPEADPEKRLVYLPYLHEAEIQLARDLWKLRSGRCLFQDRAEPLLDSMRDVAGIRLTDDQMAAVALALRHKIAVITGGPGVGKTTIVRAIVSITRRLGYRVALAAPTGRAAKRLMEATGVEGRTIHRLLEYDPLTGSFTRGPGRPVEADLVLIDETSMVDLVLARDLVSALEREASLVLIGDADQLPSVGPGRVLGDVLDSDVFPSARLVQVFRQQEGGKIVENAHRINQGEMPLATPADRTDEKTDFYLVHREDPAGALKLVEELVTERIPRRFGFRPGRDIQVLTPMYRGDLGADNLNARLQELINPGEGGLERGGQTFRPGDRVMQLLNDYDKNVFNGDVGRVVRTLPENRLMVEIDGKAHTYSTRDLENLTLAYAVTVHKAQGSEYPAVVVPLTASHWPLLQRNLLYTAVTRGKKLVVLVGERRALERAVDNDRIRKRYGRLQERLGDLARPGSGRVEVRSEGEKYESECDPRESV